MTAPKYPNGSDFDYKAKKFFGDPLHKSLIFRVSNEMSHAEGTIDRSSMPIDLEESHKVAKFVIDKIRKADPEQHDAFERSIAKDVL